MTERFAYWAFLAVAFACLLFMTVALAAIWIALLRRNRQAGRTRQPPARRAGNQTLPKPTPPR